MTQKNRQSPPVDVAERALDAWLAFRNASPDYYLHGNALLRWEQLDEAMEAVDESMVASPSGDER